MNHLIGKIAYQKQQGFTLIETLFAILIFSAAVVSLLAIAGKGINATAQVKNETIAFYLAQEGIETVRNIRDSNYTSGAANWDDGFAGITDCSAATGCYLDFQGGAAPVLSPNSGNSDEVYLANGLYTNQSGNVTGFRRLVQVVPVASGGGGNPEEYLVITKVSWNSKGVTRTVELRTIIKKWQ
jgi:prepilin-type N-terminal cleavage/methylation domain-containing protein